MRRCNAFTHNPFEIVARIIFFPPLNGEMHEDAAGDATAKQITAVGQKRWYFLQIKTLVKVLIKKEFTGRENCKMWIRIKEEYLLEICRPVPRLLIERLLPIGRNRRNNERVKLSKRCVILKSFWYRQFSREIDCHSRVVINYQLNLT